MMIEVPTGDLKRVLGVLLDHAAKDGVLRVPDAAFWSVPAPAAYDIYQEPSDLTIGMVSDSLDNLAAIIRDPDRAIDHGLVWLAEVLRAAGDGAST
ncbi:hypothetical protein [Promicromonospora sp. NPDC023987]|uniref:hypothetical protein n=1 Tax=Promicromonospora sp. NPDC023987 TaxID=3155360 RepID=UPI0033C968AE